MDHLEPIFNSVLKNIFLQNHLDFSLNIGQELEILITFLPVKDIEIKKQVIILAKNIERKNKKTLTKQTQDKNKNKTELCHN